MNSFLYLQIILVFFAFLVIPAYLIYSLLRGKEQSKYDWLIETLHVGGFILLAYLIAPWQWISYYLRYVWVVLFFIAALVSYRRVMIQPFFKGEGRERWLSKPWTMLEMLVIVAILGYTFTGYWTTEGAVNLDFPLQDGRYQVVHGGDNFLLNRHRVSRAQQYALDIVELNKFGNRTAGIYPQDLERYVIYGETIYSPCDGSVTSAVDGLPDNIPPNRDTENLAGNHVVIACKNVKVTLAHMQNQTVIVEDGDLVTPGQALGAVGNSGNTTEPHLHIHAVVGSAPDVLQAEGVPIEFGNNYPVRNELFIR